MRRLTLTLLLVLAAALCATAQGTYTQIDYPGAADTQCYGINTAGDLVGYYHDANFAVHGFLFSNGAFSNIDYPDAPLTYLTGINDAGQVVGGTDVFGFEYDVQSQTFTQTIMYPGSSYTSPAAINNDGMIVGSYDFQHGNSSRQVGFELSGSRYRRIAAPLMSGNTQLVGITSHEVIIGIAAPNGGQSVIFSNGKLARLNIPALHGVAFGIDPTGNILVGEYSSSSTSVGFSYSGGVLTTLTPPGAAVTYALGVNTSGSVTGWFDAPSAHCFLWTPPGPQTHGKKQK